ncbi:hypothetical protein [Ktedonobacter robiniae]|uniref:hypothetical protein n=1 Tax=Ktedonobacter robiniae TaxID=2778365 RepID=UPI001916C14D|nr:hypothetical protein [Ktedonobacter robiniae]
MADTLSAPTLKRQEPQEKRHPVGLGFQTLLALTNAAAWMAIIPLYQLCLPLQVEERDSLYKESELAFVTFLAGITALVAQPLAGPFSNRTKGCWGCRRPWLLLGTGLTVSAMLLLANAHSVLALTLHKSRPRNQHGARVYDPIHLHFCVSCYPTSSCRYAISSIRNNWKAEDYLLPH